MARKDKSKQDRPNAEIIERGDIFFLYRPRVDEEDPAGIEDVQRFFVVLRPEEGGKARLMVIGRKRLPDMRRHDREWGFVETVGSPETLSGKLREESYDTKTRGRQLQPGARPAGEGRYAVTLTGGQMHLAYVLELPDEPGAVQRSFRIAREGSFALSVKNPEKGSPPGAVLGSQQEADYPARQQKEFRGRRFAREDVHLLDVEGAEFVLVGARVDPEEAYGVDLQAEEEDEGHAEILRELHLRHAGHPIKPLFEGRWA